MRGNLSRRLFTYFMVVIVLSLTSVGIFTYTRSSNELNAQSSRQLSQIANNALYQTDLYLQTYERSMTSLLSNKDVKQFIDMPVVEGYDYYNYSSLIKEIGMKPIFIRNPEVVAIYIISYHGNAVLGLNSGYEQTMSPKEVNKHLSLLKEKTNNDGTLSVLNRTILPERKDSIITLARKIRGLTSRDFNGILAIEIQSKDLSTLWGGIDLGEKGYFYIADSSGEIVYHPNQDKIGTRWPEAMEQQVQSQDAHTFEGEEAGEERMFVTRKSAYSGWTLICSMPLDELQKPVANIRTTTLVVGLCTLAVALWLSHRFGTSITRPIRALKNGMRQTEKGNWMTIPVSDPKGEIDQLTISYNLMVSRLSELVKQVYEAELINRETQLERQKAEFQSLQMQINPHFLYNTLETIVCYAALKDSTEITDIVKSMAYMLRYSVQTNLEEITVANELKHILNYTVILKHRIEREFEIDVAVPPQYLLKKMVRLTLQPLVENAFQHAFPDGVEDYHSIRIDAGEEDGFFWVTVEDNGCGMTPEQLHKLRERLETNRLAEDNGDTIGSKQGGIGVLNVHRRIQMVFGEQYGLRIDSKEEEGTKIWLMMPASG
ncbi:cache domain-containing sensor histidine kinase [Paenibacillus rigui]|uniref:Signal protein n=1 Tax=Paenibacillus rigui TaxID=554312 RepID=A0A229UX29_9BACL|nr:histidine kinase [Paenibacillus rigui]OXM87811.1 signal protein [Paenibacillus rigui]